MTRNRVVLFLSGNGHDPIRLKAVRAALNQNEKFTLIDLPYAKVETFDALLEGLEREIHRQLRNYDLGLVYATGIGALVALALRARGAIQDLPLILQGGVLWGLERRWFPRLMRIGPMPRLLAYAFTMKFIRRHFAARHFESEHSKQFLDQFFDGYRDARAFEAWFRWLTPSLLRSLEQALADNERALTKLEAWWGDHDQVVGLDELRITERALGVRVPLRQFKAWGHYPMVDDPGGWVREVGHALEQAATVS